MNRRQFISRTSAAGFAMAAPMILPARLFGASAPSSKITLGFIGMGGQGIQKNLITFLGIEDAKVVAVCDAFMRKTENAQSIVNEHYGNTDCKGYQDFRYILNDPAIDAVVISTPDHWHVPMSLMALDAGKDVFCEKPTLSINEGRVLADAFAKTDKLFQAGLEDRSTVHFHKMVEWVKNGAIGNLEQVIVHMPGGNDHALQDPIDPPEDLDWNLWQGPAPYHPYTKSRTGGGHWRHISMYSKGAITDMGAHLIDTAQIGVNDPDICPVQVSGTGEIPVGRMSDVPISYDLTYKYGSGVEMKVKNGSMGGWDPDACYLEFKGSKGWIRRQGWTGGLEASDRKILRTRYAPSESKHFPLPKSEHHEFIDCFKSRKRPTYPALDLHDLSTTCLMGVHAIELGRTLRWDPKKEQFINDKDANALRFRPPARDWEKGA